MRLMSLIVVILLLAVPVFAVFLLIHRLEHNTRDEDAGMRFYEALREQYGKNNPEKIKRALTEDERIALAKRISEDPFADVTAADVISDEPEEKESAVPEKAGDSEGKSASESVTDTEGKMSREDAVAAVSALLGSSREKNKKGKGRNSRDGGLSAMTELEITLAKYRAQIESNKNETK